MNIYYVNKRSSIKGPYDIIDSHRNNIMNVGDVCIRESNNGSSFLLIVSTVNKWSACKCVGFVPGQLAIDGNTLLFSFDGISKRKGNISILDNLSKLFNKYPIHDFFINALDILLYKCDFWDVSIFNEIHLMSPFEFSYKIVNSQPNTSKKITKFESYLSENAATLFTSLYEKNMPLRAIYKSIKEIYPSDFRQAMISFLKDNPKSSIYDKP